jgi:hypothetical protein
MPPGRPGLLLGRLVGALCLRSGVYAEVAADPRAGLQCGILVAAVGATEASVHAAVHHGGSLEATMVVEAVLAGAIGWLLWSALAWFLPKKAFGLEREFREVARAVGFAHGSGLSYGLGLVPALTPWVGLVRLLGLLWFLGALHAAMRGLFGVGASRALRVTLLVVGGRILFDLFVGEVLPNLRLVPGT